ncbi:UNVERIFIED_CONTAM: hypothetical protein HDU68_003929 [Siphonaria sp. JEL0065]|nr:hypothetical protein HDU68_003929 [Siphonaria sp. JEL0065]
MRNDVYLNHEIIQENVDAKVVIVPPPPIKPIDSDVKASEQDFLNLTRYFESIDGIMKDTVLSLE